MQGMLGIDGQSLVSGKSMLVVLCLAIGTIIGEIIGIEKGFESELAGFYNTASSPSSVSSNTISVILRFCMLI